MVHHFIANAISDVNFELKSLQSTSLLSSQFAWLYWPQWFSRIAFSQKQSIPQPQQLLSLHLLSCVAWCGSLRGVKYGANADYNLSNCGCCSRAKNNKPPWHYLKWNRHLVTRCKTSVQYAEFVLKWDDDSWLCFLLWSEVTKLHYGFKVQGLQV